MGTIARMDVRLAMDASDFEGGIAKAQQSAESLSAKLGKAGAAMSLGVTAPLAGIATMAVKSAGDFEQSMNVMAQVTGATGAQMETLQAQALELGAVTSFSAGEAADAMLELGKAGLTPIEIGGAIAGTMDLAAAGNLGLAEAATITANALNAFQLPAEKAADVANLLAAAANASSVDVGDLAAGMQMAGAVFSANGQSLEDLTAAMAILGNNAITGSDAGTSLKTMLMRLSAPTDEAAAAMNSLGLQVFNADGSMRGFEDIVGQLERSTAGLSDQERNMALNTIFGADAIRAATILAREGADGFADMSKAVNKSGAAAATANARMKGIGGAVEYLKGSIDSFLIETALPFLDSLSGMVRGAADLLSSFSDLPAPIRNAALAFAGVAAAIGPVLLIASKLAPVLGMVGATIGFLASPVGLLLAGVVALGAAWATNFGGIRTVTLATIGQLAPVFEGLYDIFVAGEEPLGDWSYWWEQMGDVVGKTAASMIADVAVLAKDIGGAIGALLSGDFAKAGDMLRQFGVDLGWLWKDIQAIDWGGALSSVTDSLAGLASGVVTALESVDWGGALATAGGWLDGLRDSVISAVQSVDWAGGLAAAGEWLAGLRGGVVGAIASIDWGAHLAAAGEFLAGLAGGVVSAVQSIDWGGGLTAAGDFLSGLWGGVVTALRSIDWGAHLAAAGEWLAGLWGGVVAAIQGIDWGGYLTAAGDWLAGLRGSVTGALTAIDWGAHLATANAWLGKLTAGMVASIKKIDWDGALKTSGDAFAGLETAVTNNLAALGFTGAGAGLEEMKSSFAGLPEMVTSTQQAIAKFGASAALAFAPIAAFFAPALGRLQAAFAGLPAGLAPLMPKLQELGAAFARLGTALMPLVLLVGGALAIAVEFGINRLTTAFETLPDILGPIIDHITATINLIAAVVDTLAATVRAIFTGDWKTAWAAAQVVVTEFNTFFRGLFSRLGAFMGAVARNISDPIIETLKTLGIDIVAPFSALYKTFETWWGNVATTLQPVTDAVAAVKKVIDDFVAWVNGLNITPPWANWGAPPSSAAGAATGTDPTQPPNSGGLPNNGGYPVDVTPPAPNGIMGGSSAANIPTDFGGGYGEYGALAGAGAGPLIGPVYVTNEVDLAALAFQVAQLLDRRR